MDVDALIEAVESALGLIDADSRSILSLRPGIAYEAFVFAALGDGLVAEGDWDWKHPTGTLALALNDGGDLGGQVAHLSHVVGPGGVRLVPAVQVTGRSGASHQIDLLVVDAATTGATGWKNTLVAIECKNVVKARSLGTARDLVGLAADLRLGSHYRLWRSRAFGVAVLVAAHAVTASATDLLDHWALQTTQNAQPPIGATWIADVIGEIQARC